MEKSVEATTKLNEFSHSLVGQLLGLPIWNGMNMLAITMALNIITSRLTSLRIFLNFNTSILLPESAEQLATYLSLLEVQVIQEILDTVGSGNDSLNPVAKVVNS